MDNFTKVIRPGQGIGYSRAGNECRADAFAKIQYTDGKLSIVGVIGPLSNGNASGSCGQCVDDFRALDNFAEGWDADSANMFATIWDAWHLNDMRAYNAEMKAEGWHKLATKEVTRYRWSLKTEIFQEQKRIRSEAMAKLEAGEWVALTDKERETLAMPLEKITFDDDTAPEGYGIPMKSAYSPHKEIKTLGWLRPDEHPDGLLGKKLNGHGYGSGWYREDVPDDVLQWLYHLPNADRKPAWV